MAKRVWANEREAPVERSFQVLVGHVEVVVGVLPTGEGIGAACMLTEELAVFVLLGVLLGPQEQHVLTEVRQARDVPRVR